MLLNESVGAGLKLMTALVIDLYDYDVLVFVLGDGGTDDGGGDVILPGADTS